MKIIIFYVFLILIFIPILFNLIFITRTVEEGFKGKGKKKKNKNKEVMYKMTGDNGSYSFVYGKNTIEILPSNKKNKIADIYFNYRSLPDKTVANGDSFDDISSNEFMLTAPKNNYKISFSSSKKPITIIVNESQYMIELEKKDKEGKYDILWYNKVSGTIDGFDVKLTEKKLDDVEVLTVLYTAILITKKMKDLDNVDYNKIFK
jgi:hypothetical protein